MVIVLVFLARKYLELMRRYGIRCEGYRSTREAFRLRLGALLSVYVRLLAPRGGGGVAVGESCQFMGLFLFLPTVNRNWSQYSCEYLSKHLKCGGPAAWEIGRGAEFM